METHKLLKTEEKMYGKIYVVQPNLTTVSTTSKKENPKHLSEPNIEVLKLSYLNIISISFQSCL